MDKQILIFGIFGNKNFTNVNQDDQEDLVSKYYLVKIVKQNKHLNVYVQKSHHIEHKSYKD